MNQDQIEATLAFHRHELMLDEPAAEDRRWLAYAAAIEQKLGHDLDGDQEVEGYSIDQAYDYFLDGADIEQAVAEFRFSIAQSKNCLPLPVPTAT